MKATKTPWKCPKCQAPDNAHGRGGQTRCIGISDECGGFLCECDDESELHGTAFAPCLYARCYHCGWEGTFPLAAPPDWPSWAKKAIKEGWVPPSGWEPKG